MEIRKVTLDDASRICSIYNYYIVNTAITFETEPVKEDEMKQRIADIINEGLPYYVGVIDGKIVGYYYIHKWNNRCAYSSTKEVSIYLDKDQKGKGLGSILFDHLFKNVDREKVHVLISGITIPNDSSVKLHEKFGFKQASHMKEIGRKFEEWRDVGHWQIIL
jgi:L-amino acid N-acyltransferase YncA